MFKKLFISAALFLLIMQAISGKNTPTLPPGFPDRSSKLDVLPGFKNPPKGYGEVSFYWWLGDTLTRERITSQLEKLKDMSITGLQINYCHTDKGGATYGLTYPSKPALFSEKWWELFRWFVAEAKKYNMSVSLSDYTLGAAGQGWYVDEMLKENPSMIGAKIEMKQYDANNTKDIKIAIPKSVMRVVAYRIIDKQLQAESALNLLRNVQNDELNWKSPEGDWKIIVVYKTTVKTSFDPMNPLSGQKTIEMFFQRFENNCPGEAGKGLNFFFSDELQFGIRGWLWNEKFSAEFLKRKGYDITPKLEQLYVNLGSESYKTRMDYNDVMVSLSEEGFFKPVYDWHTSRGMLFGCDHGGRGRDVTEFGDYFRTQRWTSGPGNDQPHLRKDIIKNKVASSIAHMYERPRTWLEGFYGSGWGTSSAEVADATFANFAMGHNLLSLHGLYYSTHGSSWEWAAPDNHFRQPYWENMKDFLKCSERLSYVLSQGHHRCDIAMIYPIAPTEANLKGKEATETAFDIARDLYPNGIDFDFMDFESLERSQIKNKELQVSGEKFKVLILPALAAVRYSTIEKALAFYRAGGLVIAVGSLPQASERIGANDPKLQTMIREIFGMTYENTGVNNHLQKNKVGGLGIFLSNIKDVKSTIKKHIQPDFEVLLDSVTSDIQHRKIGNRDLYFVYDVPKGTNCFFRVKGKAELWNPWNGSTKPLKVVKVSATGTTISLPLEKNEPQLIVFSPGKAEIETVSEVAENEIVTLDNNNWEFELKPTLDNKYGDYRLPAYDAKIGVEVWKMKYAAQNAADLNWQQPTFDDSNWTTAMVSYGPQFLKLGPFPANTDFEILESKLAQLVKVDANQSVEMNGKQYSWAPYEFSWRWGLKDDRGHQGYHGLKGEINNELISFGKIDKSKIHIPSYPLSKEPEGTVYYLWSTVLTTKKMPASINKGGIKPTKIIINQSAIDINSTTVELKQGINSVLLKYNSVGRGYFVFEDNSAAKTSAKAVSLATDWYLKSSVFPFNCFPQSTGDFGWYRFVSPPGARTMYIVAKAKPAVWISGVEVPAESTQSQKERLADKNLQVWKVSFPASIIKSATVAVKVEQLPGFYSGAAIPEPITLDCGKGEISLGDLDKNESLRTYSGGLWYRKTVTVNAQQSVAKNIMLDLGDVVASANVYVNGQLIGQKATSPWTFDLTAKLKAGENRIEILVFNTLGNHYLNTPSQYVGRTNSGLIGPVRVEFTK